LGKSATDFGQIRHRFWGKSATDFGKINRQFWENKTTDYGKLPLTPGKSTTGFVKLRFWDTPSPFLGTLESP